MGRPAYADQAQQLPLQRTWTRQIPPQPEFHRRKPLCAGCREREARYGFQDPDAPLLARPRTLCFECFRMEIDRRQAAEEQRARGWDAVQAELPLEDKLRDLARRRGRAQIAARKAIGA
jgi:hypothetical protein